MPTVTAINALFRVRKAKHILRTATVFVLAAAAFAASVPALAGQYWYLEKQETLKNGELRCTYYASAVVNGKYTIEHLIKYESDQCASKIWVD